ncbi:MAG: RNA polymerase sigma factor RpoH [Hyphomicrobiales bacterium]
MAQGNLPTISSGDGGLSSYLSEVRKYPMLEPQEEFMLAKAYQEHGDRAAVEKMVTSHLRLVAKVAMGYRGYGLPIGEVVSEGNVGLMQAVKKFDPDKGFRLATYAMWWIKASIQEYVLRSWSLVKIGTTASQKRLFFNLRKVKGQIQAVEDGDLRPEQVTTIATRLGVSESDVLSMNQRMSGDKSLNAPIRTEDGAGEFQDWLVDEGDTPDVIYEQQEELDHRRALLKEAIDVLDERETRIFQARRIEEPSLTLEQLSEEFDVSRERIRQIEVRAFEKVQRAVKRLSRESLQSNIEAIEAPNH